MATMLLEQITGLPKASGDNGVAEWMSSAIKAARDKPMFKDILSGIPDLVVEKEPPFTKWSLPELFSFQNLRVIPKNLDTDPMVLLLDDIHLCNKTIQGYLFQLLTYRSIHNHRLPKNVSLFLAGNRSDDKAGFQQMLAPVTNRIYFLDVRSESDDWVENFAIPQQVRTDIITFIQNRPEMLSSPPLENQPWASPRSWTHASLALDQYESRERLTDEATYHILKGHIGGEYSAKFIEYRALMMKWNAERILNKTERVDIAKLNQTELYALQASMVDYILRRMRKKKFKTDKEDNILINNFKDIIEGIFKKCKVIVPLGLKVLIFGEKQYGKTNIAIKVLKDSPILQKLADLV
jgi:hypothetical protein